MPMLENIEDLEDFSIFFLLCTNIFLSHNGLQEIFLGKVTPALRLFLIARSLAKRVANYRARGVKLYKQENVQTYV